MDGGGWAAYWNSVKRSNDAGLIQSYIDKYPDGAFVTVAQILIEQATGTKQRAQSGQQLAVADPKAADGSEVPPEADPDLERKIQSALADAGCDPGAIDGQWGRKSQRALDRFARYARLTLPGEPVSTETLRLLRGYDGRVCPLSCGVRQVEKDGRCVTKICPSGQTLSRTGECVHTSKPAQQKAKQQRPAVQQRPGPRSGTCTETERRLKQC